jgi:hypothetical protein
MIVAAGARQGMFWEADMNLSREITDLELQLALSKICNVKVDQILVRHDPETVWVENLENILITCQIRRQRGDFPLYMEVCQMKQGLMPSDEKFVAGLICEALNCEAIITNGFHNPYVWTLVSGPNQYKNVEVDAKMLDNENTGFIIVDHNSSYTSLTE